MQITKIDRNHLMEGWCYNCWKQVSTIYLFIVTVKTKVDILKNSINKINGMSKKANSSLPSQYILIKPSRNMQGIIAKVIRI